MAHILIIDDEEGMRTLTRNILERDGHRVSEARDGKEGAALYREERPDIVLTDLIMPEGDGIEVAVALKKEFGDVKIIIMSAGGDLATSENYLAAARTIGIEHTIAKPFQPQELIALVNRLLAAPP